MCLHLKVTAEKINHAKRLITWEHRRMIDYAMKKDMSQRNVIIQMAGMEKSEQDKEYDKIVSDQFQSINKPLFNLYQ